MQFFTLKADATGGPIPVGLNIDRYRARLFGWHFATLYRHDIILQKTGDHTTHWWLYVSPFDSLGFGIHFPVWLSKKLGLTRDYTRDAVAERVTLEQVFAAVQDGTLTESEATDLLVQIRVLGSVIQEKEEGQDVQS